MDKLIVHLPVTIGNCTDIQLRRLHEFQKKLNRKDHTSFCFKEGDNVKDASNFVLTIEHTNGLVLKGDDVLRPLYTDAIVALYKFLTTDDTQNKINFHKQWTAISSKSCGVYYRQKDPSECMVSPLMEILQLKPLTIQSLRNDPSDFTRVIVPMSTHEFDIVLLPFTDNNAVTIKGLIDTYEKNQPLVLNIRTFIDTNNELRQRSDIMLNEDFICLRLLRSAYKEAPALEDGSFLDVDDEVWTAGSGKRKKTVEYRKANPVTIDHGIIVDGKTLHIRSFICHIGSGTGKGHYVAYVKSDDNWYKYNDGKEWGEKVDDIKQLLEANTGVSMLMYSELESETYTEPEQRLYNFQDKQGNVCYRNAGIHLCWSIPTIRNRLEQFYGYLKIIQ